MIYSNFFVIPKKTIPLFEHELSTDMGGNINIFFIDYLLSIGSFFRPHKKIIGMTTISRVLGNIK
jgi:hypothetical protein